MDKDRTKAGVRALLASWRQELEAPVVTWEDLARRQVWQMAIAQLKMVMDDAALTTPKGAPE